MERRILLILIFGLLQSMTILAVPQRDLNRVKEQSKTNQNPTHAKILKQINTVNEDGSYTFGYESDDGSFKVETRSKDGVVKGRYGFIDPTGQLKTIEYTAGENASKESDSDSDLSMAGATDSKTVAKSPSEESNSSSEEVANDEEIDNNTFNSFGTPRPEESPLVTQQYPRQADQGQYFREVSRAEQPEQPELPQYQQQPGAGRGGDQNQNQRQGQGPQQQQQLYPDERQFDEGPTGPSRFPARQFDGRQFSPQQQQQYRQFGGGPESQFQGQRFSNPQQQYLYPQQGPFIGSQGPQYLGGNGVNGSPQLSQQRQFSPQQFRQFGGGPQQVSGGQGQRFNGGQFQPQYDGFGQGFGAGQDFDGFGGGGPQQNPNLGGQFGRFDGVNGGAGAGAGAGGVRQSSAGGRDYVPNVELDGFSEDADQDGFVDSYPSGPEGGDKKTAQAAEKTPSVKTTDGEKVREETPLAYRPQILGPQQFQPQQPGFGQNQFGASPYDDDQLNQLYLQQQGGFGPGGIPQYQGGPQQQYNPQYHPQQFGPQYFQPNYNLQQQRPYIGGAAAGGISGSSGISPQSGAAGGAGFPQPPRQLQLSPGQAQITPGGERGLNQFSNNGANIQAQYIPPGSSAGQSQSPYLQQQPGGPGVSYSPQGAGGVGIGYQQGPGIGYEQGPGYPFGSPFGGPGQQYLGSPGQSGLGPTRFGLGPQYQQQFPSQQPQFLNGGQPPSRGQSIVGLGQQSQSQLGQGSQQLGQGSQPVGIGSTPVPQGSQQLSLGGIVRNFIGMVSGNGVSRPERGSEATPGKKTS